ncbi:MAG: hypothetical protein JSR45_00515 [Proteobacteria bacterium]|nr:hypothetical protein [Pseudomonadota bacterium]
MWDSVQAIPAAIFAAYADLPAVWRGAIQQAALQVFSFSTVLIAYNFANAIAERRKILTFCKNRLVLIRRDADVIVPNLRGIGPSGKVEYEIISRVFFYTDRAIISVDGEMRAIAALSRGLRVKDLMRLSQYIAALQRLASCLADIDRGLRPFKDDRTGMDDGYPLSLIGVQLEGELALCQQEFDALAKSLRAWF